VVVAPVALAAVPGQYGAPEWLPFRHDVNGGGINVGCTYASSDGLCAGHHAYWAIDFLTATGTPVYAAGAGIATNVTGSGFEGYGNAIVVDHGNYGTSLYAHLSEILVGSGQWVDQNSLIGRVGSSGGANTPHLHYEESASLRFGSAGSRDPGPMKACRGAELVTFPQLFGSSTWKGLPWGSGLVASDGTACDVLGGVTDAIGATVANGVAPVKPVAAPAPEQLVAADFNGDGIGDVGFRNSATGVFTMRSGPSFANPVTYPWAVGANYQPFAADFNADKVADLGLRDSTSGTFYIKHGPTFADQLTYPWTPGATFQVVAGDFNADRMADIGLRDTATGLFTMKNGPTFGADRTYQSVAGSGYQVLAADFNGDRMADLGMRNTGTGVVSANMAPTFAGQVTYAWSPGASYQVAAADFNNDGTADLVLKSDGVAVLDIRHGPTFTDEITAPLDPRLDPLAALLGGLFATLAAKAI
jgi:hypothetical protein